jgi:8-oxo-dGTP pyrophosphatase MutT (NUDIX family)
MPMEIKELRYGSYVIPVRIKDGKKQIAIIEYRPGEYGTIGGRFEDYETIARDALRRELIEELNSGAEIIADIATEISEPYKFKVAPERVAFRSARNEIHYFFVAQIPSDTELVFCEKCAGNVHIVWLDYNALSDEKVIGFPDEREYFGKYIIPLIQDMH